MATTTRGHSPGVPETVKNIFRSIDAQGHTCLNREHLINKHNPQRSSSSAPGAEVEPTQPEEKARYIDGEMSDSMPPQPEAGADEETGPNQGDAEHSDEAGTAVSPADATTAPDSAEREADDPLLQIGEPSGVAQGDPPESTGASPEQLFDANMSYNKNRSQEQEYPSTHEQGDGHGEEEKHLGRQRQNHQFEGDIDGSQASPAGFGVEGDTVQQLARGDTDGFDAGDHGRREPENGAMYPSSAQDHGRFLGNSGGHNDGGGPAGGMEGSKFFGDSAEDAREDSGSRSRRMFDGSRVAEPDDHQIVDAGEGADVIPGVDDLPVFANDQSKALNDETKVKQGWR